MQLEPKAVPRTPRWQARAAHVHSLYVQAGHTLLLPLVAVVGPLWQVSWQMNWFCSPTPPAGTAQGCWPAHDLWQGDCTGTACAEDRRS